MDDTQLPPGAQVPRAVSTEALPRCESCAEPFEPRFSKDGEHCFQCSVHLTCACADPAD